MGHHPDNSPEITKIHKCNRQVTDFFVHFFAHFLAPSKLLKTTYKGLLGHFGTQNLLMVHWQCARIIVVATPGSLTTMTTALMQGMDGH